MNLSVENIQAVHGRFKSFVGNLNINREERYLHLCKDQQNDFEFYNVCHRATLEIENLHLQGKYDFIQYYFTKFQNLQNKLESIIPNLEKKWLANQINIAKVDIDKVFVCLKEFNSRNEKHRENNDKATLTSSLNEIQTAYKKKQPKGVWGLVSRYNFLEYLGVWDKLNKLTETEKANAISQILGCNPDNAKKLKNGTYPTTETQTEQLERKQLIDLIKQAQTD